MVRKQNGDRKLMGMAEKKVVRDGKNHHTPKRCEKVNAGDWRRWCQWEKKQADG